MRAARRRRLRRYIFVSWVLVWRYFLKVFGRYMPRTAQLDVLDELDVISRHLPHVRGGVAY